MRPLGKPILYAMISVTFIAVETNAQFETSRRPIQPERPADQSIKEALNRPWSNLFYIQRTNGVYEMGDTVSHFNNNKDFEHLTFDISNNKVLANMGIRGTLKNITVYRDTYFASCSERGGLTDRSWPGVWAAKDNSSYGPYSFRLDINGENYDLDSVDWDFRTGLLENIFPVTQFRGPGDRFEVKLIAFAPISSDGSRRVRGLVYGLFLENKSDDALTGIIHLPKLLGNDRQAIGKLSWALFDPYDYEMALADTDYPIYDLPYELKKGESIWVPVVFNMLGDDALEEVNDHGSLEWMNQTAGYFRNMMGALETPGDPYLAEYFERQVMAAFGAIAMSQSGKIAGSNWGSYPATRQIWMKDLFYTSLPFNMLDKELARKLILWFDEFGVRPKGNIMEGGVSHSVGISMASIMLGGFYYKNSGDKEFFLQNIQLKQSWQDNLQKLIASRKDPEIWLFPSRYISDGYILPDYHTGSNVCAWYAIKTFARLLNEVYHEPEAAVKYEEIAGKVHADIMNRCTVDGPYGRQFIEATYSDGRQAPMESDGEESDITLMPLYGFLSWDDPTYLNYMRFSMSVHNKIYQPDLHAITWYDVQSTAPGYMKGMCAGTDKNSLYGEHGYFTEIRRVADADGSMWWWSYGWPAERIPEYGEVVRGVPGKSGWFSGIYASVFLARQLGLSLDKSTNSLQFAPLMPTSGFDYRDLSFNGSRFSLDYQFDDQSETVKFMNINPENFNMEISLPVPPGRKGIQTYVNGKLFKETKLKKYLGQDYVSFSVDVPEGKEINIRLTGRNVRRP